jgi:transposase
LPAKIVSTAVFMLWDGRLPLFCHHRGSTKEESMSLDLLAIDLGKRSFHIHGIDSDGVIISRKVSRAKLIGAIEELAPAVIAMEACASAHYWGRRFLAAGHQIRLINPRFVKPFVKGSKNDAPHLDELAFAAIAHADLQQPPQMLERLRQCPALQGSRLIKRAGLLFEQRRVMLRIEDELAATVDAGRN